MDNNIVTCKTIINKSEFEKYKIKSIKSIIRESYLLLDFPNISIKEYDNDFKGLIRVEVKFDTLDEMKAFKPLNWFGNEITKSPLAFDAKLIHLNHNEFVTELKKYVNITI